MFGSFAVRIWPAAGLVLILLVISLLSSLLGGKLIQLSLVEMLVKVVVVVGLYIFIGNSGILSFGHVAFMLVGGYCSAWMTLPVKLKAISLPGLPVFFAEHQYNTFLAAMVSGGLTAAFAGVIGVFLMRLSGLAASMAMFGVLAILNEVYSNWDAVTLGLGTLVGLPTYVRVWVAFAWAAVAIAVAFGYQSSRFGLALRAARDDAVAAEASAINIMRQRILSLALSAFFVGIGGVLFGHFLGAISVDLFFLQMTFITLVMLIVGGMRSLSGAVVGVVVISALVEGLRRLESGIEFGETTLAAPAYSQELGLALVMILILLFRPNGLMAGAELQWPPRIRLMLGFGPKKGDEE